jgi:Ca2+-binding RTX toxin-like protein
VSTAWARLVPLAGFCGLVLALAPAAGGAPGQCIYRNPTIVGTPGNDSSLTGTPGDDVIAGQGGNDVIDGGGGHDTICGDAGRDSIKGGSGDDDLDGGAGDDTADGGRGIDAISYLDAPSRETVKLGDPGTASGGLGHDKLKKIEQILASNYGDRMTGDAGTNYFFSGPGADHIKGGGGFDILSYDLSFGSVSVSLVTGTATGNGEDRFSGIDNVVGSDGSDFLVGDGGDNFIAGGPGPDEIYGRAGTDTLIPGSGDDILEGGAGIDIVDYLLATAGVQVDLAARTGVSGSDDDYILSTEGVYGSPFPDQIAGDGAGNLIRGRGGDDDLDGRGGLDTISYAPDVLSPETGATATAGPITADLATGEGHDAADPSEVAGDGLAGFEIILGTSENDVLAGGDENNQIFGMAGDDQLSGGGGDDMLAGGVGSDQLDGGPGDSDTASWVFDGRRVTANLVAGTAISGADHDQLTEIESLWGSDLADTLKGDNGENIFITEDGKDTVDARGGDDALLGPVTLVGKLVQSLGSLKAAKTTDRRLDGGPGSDHCVGTPRFNCEFASLSAEQKRKIEGIIARVIDFIRHHHGVRLQGGGGHHH